jgi:AAA domain, putative AbiEii toxin, Type IV TA system/AAA ATPase domain
MTKTTLKIENFAQIKKAEIDFGDLTVLVGAQGTGKSLVLQWLKASLDGKQIVTALRDAGQQANGAELIDLIFGQGMGAAWAKNSRVTFNKKSVSLNAIGSRGKPTGQVFFIPAHRATLLADGWAAPFQRLPPDVPVAARIFSQALFDQFSSKGGDDLFPVPRLLKNEYRKLIDDAVFHGGTVNLEQQGASTKRLRLTHGSSKLPFMTWTAGQREFTPLLLGLYNLLPRTNQRKRTDVDWVIIEEPEMGLHPRAINVFMLLVLDLLWRGYKVILSTHSPDVLTAVWMLERMKSHSAKASQVCKAFGAPATQSLMKVTTDALLKTYRVHVLAFDDAGKKVQSRDISGLDPSSENEDEANWGGLTEFSSNYGDALRDVVNDGRRNTSTKKSGK